MASDIENRHFLDNEVRPFLKNELPKIKKAVHRSHENRHILADIEQRLKKVEQFLAAQSKPVKKAPKKKASKKD